MPHKPFIPNLAPCDFFFFLKRKRFFIWSSFKVQTSPCQLSNISQYLRGIHKSATPDAFQNWIQRLIFFISNHGEYFERIIMFISLFVYNAFEKSYNTHCISNNPFLPRSKLYQALEKILHGPYIIPLQTNLTYRSHTSY